MLLGSIESGGRDVEARSKGLPLGIIHRPELLQVDSPEDVLVSPAASPVLAGVVGGGPGSVVAAAESQAGVRFRNRKRERSRRRRKRSYSTSRCVVVVACLYPDVSTASSIRQVRGVVFTTLK